MAPKAKEYSRSSSEKCKSGQKFNQINVNDKKNKDDDKLQFTRCITTILNQGHKHDQENNQATCKILRGF
jgi:hypothetical protein